ncbi:uncharacterized protein HMPREF1541_02391 [Cyphellophora europaea CBS 101466]|uniref:N-acetyltransferase domain-containing protein n=1 Tax=Cyphellophora europaea (strain CBS 101466) TaxID=1220924 RepID=W2S3G7_CYPE1|nr:uncharacterized protein HMPREF1541_02391 [Cyphellophora europaea CBS 101466]ETN43232.1 hypothetical protein HMPREF1541_02391 [Cyphellophora europaea CBS 101466]
MLPPSGSHRTWTRDGFLISTDTSLIPLAAVNAAFASDALYWAKALPEPALRAALDASLCFGLYSPTGETLPPPPESDVTAEAVAQGPADVVHEIATHVEGAKGGGTSAASTESKHGVAAQESTGGGAPLIGFARVITDGVTFAYLTDVYVLEEWRGRKLGEWLVGCVNEVMDEMPHLRRIMGILGDKGMATFYQRVMGLEIMKGDEGPAWVVQRRGGGSNFA